MLAEQLAVFVLRRPRAMVLLLHLDVMIRSASDAREFGTEVAADCGQISMHARPHIAVEPWFTILGAKDDVKDDLT